MEKSQKVSPALKLHDANNISITNNFHCGSKEHFRLLEPLWGHLWGCMAHFQIQVKLTQTMFLSSLKRISAEIWLFWCLQVTRAT